MEEIVCKRSYDFLNEEEKSWFPFLIEADNGYLVNTVPKAQGHYPVIHTFHAIGASFAFLNLTTMFDTYYQWIQEGFLIVDSGCVTDVEGYREQMDKVAARLNPGLRELTFRTREW